MKTYTAITYAAWLVFAYLAATALPIPLALAAIVALACTLIAPAIIIKGE